MNDDKKREFLFHNDVLSEFTNRRLKDIFTLENVTSKKKAVPIGKNKYYGYFLEKAKESFFCIDDYFKNLPFRVKSFKEVDYKGDVFKVINDVDSIIIPSEKRMEWRQLVDMFAKFKHTNDKHWTLYKIISLASRVDRINARISTDAGFGKDSTVNTMSQTVNSIANIYGATFAKLEYVLMNKLIVLNELGNLKKDELINMQEYLLAVGAYFNTYNKRTRKTATTQEQYDISGTSLLIFYNLPEYYRARAQDYFDKMFTKAVVNRFIPFVFEGTLATKFDEIIDPAEIVDTHEDSIKDFIATLNYFQENKVKDIKYKIDDSLTFHPSLMRYERSFNTILKYVAEYSESQEEFDDLSKELYKCYKKYETLLEGERRLGDIK